MRYGLFCDFTQRRLAVCYRHFGTSYWSHLRGSISRPLKMGPLECPETSVANHHSTLRRIPEEGRSQISCSKTSYAFIGQNILRPSKSEKRLVSYIYIVIAITCHYGIAWPRKKFPSNKNTCFNSQSQQSGHVSTILTKQMYINAI